MKALLLGILAGSMIAIAGTVSSMTLAAMSLASSQFGPRLLRYYMHDTANPPASDPDQVH